MYKLIFNIKAYVFVFLPVIAIVNPKMLIFTIITNGIAFAESSVLMKTTFSVTSELFAFSFEVLSSS